MSELIEILQHIEKRPGMYFGNGEHSRSIHILQAFIVGFQCNQEKSEELAFFTEWVGGYYEVLVESRGAFHLILEHVGGDERKAFDEFFRLLPEYLRDRNELGIGGIMTRFDAVQEKRLEEFRKSSRSE